MALKLKKSNTYRVLIDGENVQIASRCKPANDFLTRLMGLMFRKNMDDDEALVIMPCNSIHTFFMRFPIDLIFLSHDLKVVSDKRNVAPGKIISPVNDSWAVIELKGGHIDLVGIGDSIQGRQVRFEAVNAA